MPIPLRPRRCFAVIVALMAIGGATGCGSTGPASRATSTTAPPVATAAFCAAWDEATKSDDRTALDQVLARVPREIAGDAAIIDRAERADRMASVDGRDAPAATPEEEAATARVLAWIEGNCADHGLRVAPPLGSTPDGLTLCSATSLPMDTGSGTVAVYGRRDLEDAYTGDLLVLAWGTEGHAGDGDSTPVTVRGVPGVVAPITVFQQVVLPELGTVVAWTEGKTSFGLYGRGWDLARSDQLVAIANGIGPDEAGWELPSDELPDGFSLLHEGPASRASFILFGDSSVSYRSTAALEAGTPSEGKEGDGGDSTTPPGGGMVTVTGIIGPPGDDELWRAFALESGPTDIGGRAVMLGDEIWRPNGPIVVSWRLDDERYVQVTGIGATRAQVDAVVTASRQLTSDEWVELVGAATSCGPGR